MYVPDEIPQEMWDAIASCEGDARRLGTVLTDAETILRFAWNYQEAVDSLKPNFFEIAHERAYGSGSLSEDGIDDLCCWVVGEGPDFYRKVWDGLPEIFLEEDGPFSELRDAPGYLSEAWGLYQKATGKALPAKPHDQFVPTP